MIENLLNKIPCGILVFNQQGKLLHVNDALCHMLELTHEELLHKHIETILTIASRIFFQTHFFPLLSMQGHAEEIFVTLQSRTKQHVPVLINAKKYETDDAIEFVWICIPVYNRKKYEDEILAAKKLAEQTLQQNTELIQVKNELQQHAENLDKQIIELEQKNEELLQINKIISHDLQEPLRKLQVFSDVLLAHVKESANTKIVNIAEKVFSVSSHMRRILSTLQEYVRLDKKDEKLTDIDLNEIFKTASQPYLQTASFSIDNMPVIKGYKNQLTLLFHHLIDNAVKFRRPDTPLHIRVQCTIMQHNSFRAIKGKFKYLDFVRIEFSDNGAGFERKYETYVFQFMRRLNNESQGLGAGLAFCKKIVDNHSGFIGAISQPGEGTTVTVFLPLHQ